MKRRVGTLATATQTQASLEVESIGDEPLYKKYKKDFDQITQQVEGPSQSTHTLQTSGRAGSSADGAHHLQGVEEEEEEEENVPPRGTKRTLGDDDDDDDDEMAVNQPSKRRATEKIDAVVAARLAPPVAVPAPPVARAPAPVLQAKKNKSNPVTGQPDKDTAFLKAIASTKRGKKNEDNFDREFNQLKISKPSTADVYGGGDDAEKEWALLGDFDTTDVRGNFMMVLDYEIPDRPLQPRQNNTVNEGKWAGRPNFKKFKKVRYRSLYPYID